MDGPFRGRRAGDRGSRRRRPRDGGNGGAPMSSGKSPDTIEIRGIQLRKDPARESVHTIVHSLHEMRNGSIATPEAQREFVHRDMNNEIQSLEIAAQTLVDFPEAAWELRVSFARQCWDE